MGLILFILVSLGISVAWNLADIFKYARYFAANIPYLSKPLLCPECNTFWIGVGVSLFLNPLSLLVFPVLSNIFCGFIAHFFSVILYRKIITDIDSI